MPSTPDLASSIVAKLGNAFLVCGRDGRLPAGEDHPFGLYLDDCRRLAIHELAIAGVAPRLLKGSEGSGASLLHELTNPDVEIGGELLPLQSLRVRVERELADERTLVERITVRSHTRRALRLPIELTLGADFRTILELRGLLVARQSPRVETTPTPAGIDLKGRAIDGTAMVTEVRCTPPPARVGRDRQAPSLGFELALAPGAMASIEIAYAMRDEARMAQRPARRAAGRAPEPATIRSDDELFNRVLHRSMADLRMLRSELDGLGFYAAGVPWYAALFGRDSIITAHQTLAFDPALAADTLRLLAGRIGSRIDAEHEEEPGKVVHELRAGPAARAHASPLTRYYGTVDATPLFLCLVADHADWSGDLVLFDELRTAIDAALAWIDEHGDGDGDGFVDYASRSSAGLVNQGWKDSWDGVPGVDGEPLAPPIALVEVQGYVVRAKRGIARLLAKRGEAERAARLRAEADALQTRLERFWEADRGHFGLALDGQGRLSPVLASNQGHLLWAGALEPGRARAVRDALMGPALYSGWGLRTLGADEPAYNPVGYHLGSVWPHDNALVAAGLRRYGFDRDFLRIFEDLLDVASRSDAQRLPELFAGFGREPDEDPVPYPVACRPQAWAAGALPYLAQAGLGLEADALDGCLRVRRPVMPPSVRRIDVSGLRIGPARVDLVFERASMAPGAELTLSDARVDGALDVVPEPGGDG